MREVDMDLNEQLRLQHVKRWTIIPTVLQQSVAEHSFNTTLIVMELMKTGYTLTEVSAAIKYSLFHDMAEVYTGDIPSTFKQKLVANGTKLNAKVEELFPETIVDASPEIKEIVKVADTIEAIYFLREFGVGSIQIRVLLDMGERLHALLKGLPDMVRTRATILIEELSSARHRM